MIQLLLKKFLRKFVEQALTPEFFLRAVTVVFDAVKRVSPQAIDDVLDSLDKTAIAAALSDFVLGLILPSLPLVSGTDKHDDTVVFTVSTADMIVQGEAVAREMTGRLSA